MAHPDLTLRGARVELASTREEDLAALAALWNDGRVMAAVGFPEGLGYNAARMAAWFDRLRDHPDRYHFVVRAAPLGFCGEAYAAVDRARGRASLDLKFTVEAQGKRLSRDALSTMIRWVFAAQPDVAEVFTEPAVANLAARTLYYSCGLREAPRPADLHPAPSYWVLRRDDWPAGSEGGAVAT